MIRDVSLIINAFITVIGAKIDQHDDSGFKKIHQFEISLKRKDTRDLEQDINNTSVRSRLSFEIRLLFPDKNEALFEANVGQFKDGSIPKFKFRDEIVVANIYE
ncbi:hypothetical protein HPULCUR_006854 [Helicostylum pulchrum]|uniref:Uncharacterized protein n=1 Tax=Helicostylum pulchrum TaxID=562976 RepID=A0ABP9Y3L4_9FUNG